MTRRTRERTDGRRRQGHEPRVAVVSGANRGLGFETCRQLARRGYRVVLTSRHPRKGRAAVERLTEEGLQVAYHRVDVTVAEHGRRLARHLDRHYGRLDVLVNNAGVFLDSSRAGASALETRLDRLRRTMETNVYGALRLCQALVPLMQRHGYGRIVNVASGMGQLAEMGGRWPAYRVSKTALNALTRILAAELAGSNILVNSVCPGWVRTDMGGPKAERSVEQGVETIVWLATRPDGSPSGDFYRDRRRIPW